MTEFLIGLLALAALGGGLAGLRQHRRVRALQAENRKLAAAAGDSWAAAESVRDELLRQQQRFEAASRELVEAHDTAVAAGRTKSAFLANMSHELRTPLNAIIGFADVMEQEMRDKPACDLCLDFVGDIKSSGQHLLSVINDILDMSKIDAGQMELRESTVDLMRLLDTCVRMMRGRADPAGVQLDVDYTDSGHVFIRADEVRLKQVVINLLANAVKFTPRGGRVTVRVFESPAREVVIRVDDSGIGMRLEDIAVALAPFRQVDNTLNRNYEGTGLGLPLSKALVEMHGGRLSIASEPGAGTHVSVILPSVASAFSTASPAWSAPETGAVADWLFPEDDLSPPPPPAEEG